MTFQRCADHCTTNQEGVQNQDAVLQQSCCTFNKNRFTILDRRDVVCDPRNREFIMSRTTGQVCPVSGVYRVGGNCGHSVERAISQGHIFPPCEHCRDKTGFKAVIRVLVVETQPKESPTQISDHPAQGVGLSSTKRR
jgi:hypothetical protein